MKSAIAVLLLAGASASSIVARDLNTVLADLADINTRVTALTPALDAFQTISDAAAVLAVETPLENAIKKATSDTEATDPVDATGATQVLQAIKDLIPNIVTALNKAVEKAPTFEAADAGSILTGRLQVLKDLTDALATALLAKAPPAAQTAGQAAISCIDRGFTSALATPPTQASDCSGDIQLPIEGGGSPSTGPTSGGSVTTPTTSGGSVTTPTTSGGVVSSPTVTLPSGTISYPATGPSGSKTSPGTGSPTGPVYTGDAASLVSHSFVGAVCVAALAFLL